MIEKFKEAFREEASELLNNLESTLLELEANPTDFETISAVFRTMHTIKGSSAMFGFDEISRFTHEVESIMDMLRERIFVADRTTIDLTLRSRDLINSMLSGVTEDLASEATGLIADFKAHAAKRTAEKEAQKSEELENSDILPPIAAAAPAEPAVPDAEHADVPNETFRIVSTPPPTSFGTGRNLFFCSTSCVPSLGIHHPIANNIPQAFRAGSGKMLRRLGY
jgi:two-component system chemotaxis sensor kinase CheA